MRLTLVPRARVQEEVKPASTMGTLPLAESALNHLHQPQVNGTQLTQSRLCVYQADRTCHPRLVGRRGSVHPSTASPTVLPGYREAIFGGPEQPPLWRDAQRNMAVQDGFEVPMTEDKTSPHEDVRLVTRRSFEALEQIIPPAERSNNSPPVASCVTM